MISIEEARQQSVAIAPVGRTETLFLHQALGRFTAEEVISPSHHPPFDHSAVDGYAFRWEDAKQEMHIVAEVKAGDFPQMEIKPGECARIFTGAQLPPGADTIVMQEYVSLERGWMSHNDTRLQRGGNIRRRGEQLRQGDIALPLGAQLTAAAIGHLAGLGVQHVRVAALPRVSIVVTGSEFADSPDDLDRGKIFESNGVMLATALQQVGITAQHERVVDDLALLTERLRQLALSQDMLLVTGGVSVGDFDFTRAALEAVGYQVVFHGVHQQPGKPLLLMRKGNQIAWGLPGNPRSVLVCFHTYVRPSLRRQMAAAQPLPAMVRMPLGWGYAKKQERPQLLTAQLTADGLRIGDGQNSHMLGSFAAADVLVHLPAGSGKWNPGDQVEVLHL
jgi:molybdopterin molybdotransferase